MTGQEQARTSGERARDLVLAAGFWAGHRSTDHPDDGTDWTNFQHADDRFLNIHTDGDRFIRAQGYGVAWGGRGRTAGTLSELVRLLGPSSVGLFGLVWHGFGERAAQLGYSCTDEPADVVLWDVRDADGRVLWNSMDPDVEPWDDLADVVDLFAPLARLRTGRGDGLVFDLTGHERS